MTAQKKTCDGTYCVDEYIARFPKSVAEQLLALRAIVRDALPDATETIAYDIPTYDMNGKHVVHFGAYAHHIGFYPVPRPGTEFDADLAHFQAGKGTARFPLGEPLPEELIRKLIADRLKRLEAGEH